jgi:hypothetical protein
VKKGRREGCGVLIVSRQERTHRRREAERRGRALPTPVSTEAARDGVRRGEGVLRPRLPHGASQDPLAPAHEPSHPTLDRNERGQRPASSGAEPHQRLVRDLTYPCMVRVYFGICGTFGAAEAGLIEECAKSS